MKINFWKPIFASVALLLLGLLAGTQAGCSKPGGVDAVKARGKLIVGVFSDKPPFGYIDAQGRNAGYDIALARRLAKDLLGDETKVEFVTLEASNRVAFLQSNKVDIILANFTRTPDRAAKVDFARPYMKVALGLVAPDSAPFANLEEFLKDPGRTLIVDAGTTAEEYFTKHHPRLRQLKFNQNSETFQAFKDGRGDAVAHDNTLLFAWVHKNKGFKVLESNIGNADVIAPAVKKGNASLLAWLNAEIERLDGERFFHAAYETELRPFFGDSVSSPGVVVIEAP